MVIYRSSEKKTDIINGEASQRYDFKEMLAS